MVIQRHNPGTKRSAPSLSRAPLTRKKPIEILLGPSARGNAGRSEKGALNPVLTTTQVRSRPITTFASRCRKPPAAASRPLIAPVAGTSAAAASAER